MANPKKGEKYIVLVDDDQYEYLAKYTWSIVFSGKFLYARTVINGKHVKMHRYIMGVSDPKVYVDHIDHNTLNNQKANLRLCNSSTNQ